MSYRKLTQSTILSFLIPLQENDKDKIKIDKSSKSGSADYHRAHGHKSESIVSFKQKMSFTRTMVSTFSRNLSISEPDVHQSEIQRVMSIIEIIQYYNLFKIGDTTITCALCVNEYKPTTFNAIKLLLMLQRYSDIAVYASTEITENNYKNLDVDFNKNIYIVDTSMRPIGKPGATETIELYKKKLGAAVDLYTCADASIGAITDMNTVLRPGAHAILHFAHHNAENIIILMLLQFTEVFVCKPQASEPTNDEFFVIGRNYVGPSHITEDVGLGCPQYVTDKLDNTFKTLNGNKSKFEKEINDYFDQKYHEKPGFMNYVKGVSETFAKRWFDKVIQPIHGINNLQIPHNHQAQYYFMFGKAPGAAKPLVSYMTPDMPRMSYEARTLYPKSVEHWGQLKLLIGEIEFLTQTYKDDQPLVLYIGSAPGTHIAILADMFPNYTFDLYDPRDFDPKLKSYAKINKFNQLFLEADIRKYKEMNTDKRILFISDIRSGSDEHNLNEFEDAVEFDLDLQRKIITEINFASSHLKFRLPYTNVAKDKGYSYFAGRVDIQAYPPPTSTETRLVPDMPLKEKIYDTKAYEEELYYHNTVARAESYISDLKMPPDLDQCYDCVRYMGVLKLYMDTVKPLPTTLTAKLGGQKDIYALHNLIRGYGF